MVTLGCPSHIWGQREAWQGPDLLSGNMALVGGGPREGGSVLVSSQRPALPALQQVQTQSGANRSLGLALRGAPSY